jgi:AraC-like DNA-binding protein
MRLFVSESVTQLTEAQVIDISTRSKAATSAMTCWPNVLSACSSGSSSDAGLSRRVAQLLAAGDPRSMPSLEIVARELGMSVRSLRRKLAAEHASYSKLLESARASAAKRLLQDPRASIQEVAFALGFATPSAFHHAFKRWTRLTPQQYRASLTA